MQREDSHTNGGPAPPLNLEAMAAQAKRFLEQVPVADQIGAKLGRVLEGFLDREVLPQARRAAEQGINPSPLFAVVADVLRLYADALYAQDAAK
jgi:hypothetical protein